MLRIVSSRPDFFAINGNLAVREGAGFGCYCAQCGRAVSAPFGYEKRLIWCLYCGLEEGYVPEIESPFPHRYTFGVTIEECIEDKQALQRGGIDALDAAQEARARRYGKIVDLF